MDHKILYQQEAVDAANRISEFLAKRDLGELTPQSLQVQYGTSKADALIVFGGDLPCVAEEAAMAFQRGVADVLLFCGGVGHSTEILRKKIATIERYGACSNDGAESEIYSEIARHMYGISKEKIYLDKKSMNSGENANFAVDILEKNNLPYRNVILMQDPLLQYRSVMCMKRALKGNGEVISYAPFLPELSDQMTLVNQMPGLWEIERYVELMIGEIPRLRDDEKGYGPKGCGFIDHVDIPEEVEEAYQVLVKVFHNLGHRNF